MRYIGSIEIEIGKQERIFINDDMRFVYEDGTTVDAETLECWAALLNSPWSYANDQITIKFNVGKDFKLVAGEPPYICTREVVGYDAMTATCVSYGASPDNALTECLALWDAIQRQFNPSGFAF